MYLCFNTVTSKNHVREVSQAPRRNVWPFGKGSPFLGHHNGSREMFVKTSKRKWVFTFLIILLICLNELDISSNIEIKYFFHFTAYFPVIDLRHISCKLSICFWVKVCAWRYVSIYFLSTYYDLFHCYFSMINLFTVVLLQKLYANLNLQLHIPN